MKKIERNHKEFDYQTIVIKKENVEEIVKDYECFGWSVLNSSQHPYYENLLEVESVLKNCIERVKSDYSDIFKDIHYVGVDKIVKNELTLRVVGTTNEKDIFTAKRILNREVYLEFNRHDIDNPVQEVIIQKDV